MTDKYLLDKTPQIFRPRVTPDPAIQSRLAEKLREALERNNKYVTSHIEKTKLVRTSVEIN